jgi:cytochrome c-type biogenesis protein CcmE
MKRTHIIALVIIAVAMAALVSSLGNSTTYADVRTAFAKPGKEFHLIGTLDRSQPVVYEPTVNASLTQFTIQDSTGRACRVMLAKARPQDLEHSERIVLIGKAGTDGNFHASDMLMKCPSKYTEENKVEL